MITEHALTPPPLPADLRRAEDMFVALAATPDMCHYLGRLNEATEEELRSVFGLALAAMRRCSREEALGYASPRAARETPAPPTAVDDLEQRVAELAAALAARDATIRELTSTLKKNAKGN